MEGVAFFANVIVTEHELSVRDFDWLVESKLRATREALEALRGKKP